MISKLLEAATRLQIRFSNREDTELQQLRERAWGDVQKEIERVIDERIKSAISRKNR
jgi:hypothetical protein